MDKQIVDDDVYFREKVCEILNKYICNETKVKEIETSIYNFSIKEATERNIVKKWDNPNFVMVYKDRFRSIWMNLKTNPALLNKIKCGEIQSNDVGSLTHQQMSPESWTKLIQRKIERDNNTFTTDTKGASKEFKCGKCKKRETTYYQVQTRSADEPMTTFVTCLNCGKNWKC